jgi:hypothetical protein
MKHNTLPSRPAVAWSKPDVCPECKHRMDDYSLSHFPDCRYFWIDTDTDEDLDLAAIRNSDKQHAGSGSI